MFDLLEPNVGLRLRALRDQRELTLRALAEKCGLSINAISLIERGENSPTVSTLQRLAAALNVPITEFFLEETRQTVVYVKRDQGLHAQSDGVVMESLGFGLVRQQLEPFRMNIHPGVGNLDDPISHPGEEFIHCLRGTLDYCVDGRTYRLERGDSLLFEASQPHAFYNSSGEVATILIIFQVSRDQHLVKQMHMER